jgi:glycerol-3-phosphate O-acyltransferase
MDEQLLEEKCHLLETGLRENLQKKQLAEKNIREQLEELKKMEITLEKARKNLLNRPTKGK